MDDSKSIFCVLFNENGEILLVENSPKKIPGGFKPRGWGLPGGGVEPDEGEMAAVAREVEEETGYTIEPETRLLDYEIKGNHFILIVAGKICGGNLKNHSASDTLGAAWFSLNNLPSTLYRSHRRRLTRACEILKKR